MGLRYLRRPPKPVSRKASSRTPVHAASGEGEAFPPPGIEVMSEECAEMARALAYFCVACGRQHASGEVRCRDVAEAEAVIIETIRQG